MTLLGCIALICAAALLAQYRAQIHEQALRAGRGRIYELRRRIEALEEARAQVYDHAAFEELKSKVDALRISQGLKGSR